MLVILSGPVYKPESHPEKIVKFNQVADDMGIHVNTLYNWIRDLSAKPEEAFPGKGHMACSDAEMVRQLKRELDRVKMERDILKKAMAIFSQDPN